MPLPRALPHALLLATFAWAQGPSTGVADLDKVLPGKVAWTNRTGHVVSLNLPDSAAEAAGYLRMAIPVEGNPGFYNIVNLV